MTELEEAIHNEIEESNLDVVSALWNGLLRAVGDDVYAALAYTASEWPSTVESTQEPDQLAAIRAWLADHVATGEVKLIRERKHHPDEYEHYAGWLNYDDIPALLLECFGGWPGAERIAPPNYSTGQETTPK